jgi:hypothetical protein
MGARADNITNRSVQIRQLADHQCSSHPIFQGGPIHNINIQFESLRGQNNVVVTGCWIVCIPKTQVIITSSVYMLHIQHVVKGFAM